MPVARLVLESLRDHIVRPGIRRAGSGVRWHGMDIPEPVWPTTRPTTGDAQLVAVIEPIARENAMRSVTLSIDW